MGTHVVVHRLVLRLECEDVLAALRPRLARVGVDVAQHPLDALLELADGTGVRVEVACAVPLPIEVGVRLQSVEAVERNEQLNAVFVGVDHEVVEPGQDGLVPVVWVIALQGRVRADGRSLLIARLTCAMC